MKFNNFEVFATVLCSWLSGFVLGIWRSTPYITDREAGLVMAFFVTTAMVTIYKRVSTDKIVAYLNRHVGEVHTMATLDLQEAHRKRIAMLKTNHNQSVREVQDKIRRLQAKFDRLNSEYDWISTIYQDQLRSNEEQDDRVDFLEKKLKEFGQRSSAGATAPFSAPASQIKFTNPPHRVRAAMTASLPLSQEPMVHVPEFEEE